MAAHTHDDAFHEIQLNGKQLVFLVMAATAVSVAIFLCGVLVGRNVRAGGGVAMQVSIAESPAADLPPAAPAAPPAVEDVRTAAPPPTVDDSAARDDDAVASEVLKPAAPRPEIPVGKTPAPAPAAPPKPREKAAARPPAAEAPAVPVVPAASAPAPGSDYAVQVAALSTKGEADVIARRLNAKGYSAYVQAPAGGSPAVFRVRVGTFKTRREAESVASRLRKEEQFKPWVTR